ncbi:BRO family protein, partial [Clostridium sp.]|uniref:BRO family protein n=1 Tax=Clostridium sp. TaxID=1506 RepID=UPI003216BDD4
MQVNDIEIFNSKEFGDIRAFQNNGQPWFCLTDVCKILDIKNVSDCKTRLNKDGVVNT